jgi:hypothetical protein
MSSRLDRLYCSSSMYRLLQSVDTLPAAFSDHMAVVCSLHCDDVTPPRPARPTASWVLDAGILAEEEFKALFVQHWRQWCAQRHRFAHAVEWWLRLAKPSIRKLAADYTKERREQQNAMLDFLQATLQELYRKPSRSAADMKCLKEVKQSILQIHADRLRGVASRAKLDSTVDNEPVSMHHVVRARRRSKQQNMNHLRTADGEVLEEQRDIAAHLLCVYTDKFSSPGGPPPPASALLHLEETVTDQDNSTLTEDITLEEVKAAVMASPKGKSPGEDGIVAELYQIMWPIIGETLLEVYTDLWQHGIPEEMLKGVIVFIPKKAGASSVKDYRPLTLLNVDGKAYARLLATRLTRLLDKLLHPSQVRPGGVRGMHAALCDLRDVISYLENGQLPACVLTVDLQAAFDSVRHDFLFQVLRRRGVSPRFAAALMEFYSGASSALRVNGVLTSSFPLRRALPQGSPLSALLFAVVVSVLVSAVHRRLQGVSLVHSCLSISAYADDLYAVLRTPHEANVVREELDSFEVVSGLRANHAKCAALPVSDWDTGVDIGWQYVKEVKVLGVTFTSNIKATIRCNWEHLANVLQGVLADNSNRNLSLSQRVWFAGVYALSKVWHVAQVLPIEDKQCVKMIQALGRFVWRGSIFRVPMETAPTSN